MLNLNKISELKNQAFKNKKKCYKKIYKNIIKTIENIISQNINFYVYEATPFIIGEVDYEMLECINYIIKKFKKDKTFIQIMEEIIFYEPNIIYIKWNLNKI